MVLAGITRNTKRLWKLTSKAQPSCKAQHPSDTGVWGTEQAQWSGYQGQGPPKHSIISWDLFIGVPGSGVLLGSYHCARDLIRGWRTWPGWHQPKLISQNFPTLGEKVVSLERSWYSWKPAGFPGWGLIFRTPPFPSLTLNPVRGGQSYFYLPDSGVISWETEGSRVQGSLWEARQTERGVTKKVVRKLARLFFAIVPMT